MSGCLKFFIALIVIAIVFYVAAIAACVLAGVGLWFLIRYIWRSLVREKPDSGLVKWGMSKAPIVRKILAGVVSAIVMIALIVTVGSGSSGSNSSSGSQASSSSQTTQEQTETESKSDDEEKAGESASDTSSSADSQATATADASASTTPETPAFDPNSYGLDVEVSTPSAGPYKAIVQVYGASDADFPTMRQAIIDAAAHYGLAEDANTVGAEFDSIIGTEGGSGATWADGGIITSAPNDTETTYRADLYVNK